VGELADRLHVLAEQWLSAEDWQPKRRVDLTIPLQDITLKAVEQLARLEPFGNGNLTPRFVIKDVLIKETRTMGKESKHLRITVAQAGQSMEAVGFGMGEFRDRLVPGARIDLLGELSVNEWNGNRKVQVMFQDFRSQHLQINDRRRERDMWTAVEGLVMNQPVGIAISCASVALYKEAQSRIGHTEIPISLYTDMRYDLRAVTQSAAASEQTGNPQNGWRHLIMLGFPACDQEVRILMQWLAPDRGGESVTVFSDPHTSRQSEDRVLAFPERKHFAEIYALCRKRGSWLDNPDGFIQETASSTGWPLSTVRMMHEVFIELGFITADGSSRKIVSEPPRRELEDSTRYRNARRLSDGLKLAAMTTEELHRWLSACHTTPAGDR
jgi:single-stranded-DNA-specific exonuclease